MPEKVKPYVAENTLAFRTCIKYNAANLNSLAWEIFSKDMMMNWVIIND